MFQSTDNLWIAADDMIFTVSYQYTVDSKWIDIVHIHLLYLVHARQSR